MSGAGLSAEASSAASAWVSPRPRFGRFVFAADRISPVMATLSAYGDARNRAPPDVVEGEASHPRHRVALSGLTLPAQAAWPARDYNTDEDGDDRRVAVDRESAPGRARQRDAGAFRWDRRLRTNFPSASGCTGTGAGGR